MGENTVESSWTVSKVSPTLSYLESVHETLVACIRRSLCYPLLRNWKLSVQIIVDVATILRLGKRAVLKCLLDVKNILDHSDYKFHLSRIYVDDYCIWIQSVSTKKLKSLQQEIVKTKVSKTDIGWTLEQLEQEAKSMEWDQNE